MADRLLPAIIVTALFLGLRWLLMLWGKLHQRSIVHEIGIGLFVLYVVMVLSLTLLPISSGVGYFQFRSTLLLMLQGKYTSHAWGNSMVLGNLLMFLPLGFLLPLLWKWFRWFRVLMVSLAAIICIELLQPLIGRSFDIDDVILNFLGSAVGLALSLTFQFIFPRCVNALQNRS